MYVTQVEDQLDALLVELAREAVEDYVEVANQRDVADIEEFGAYQAPIVQMLARSVVRKVQRSARYGIAFVTEEYVEAWLSERADEVRRSS